MVVWSVGYDKSGARRLWFYSEPFWEHNEGKGQEPCPLTGVPGTQCQQEEVTSFRSIQPLLNITTLSLFQIVAPLLVCDSQVIYFGVWCSKESLVCHNREWHPRPLRFLGYWFLNKCGFAKKEELKRSLRLWETEVGMKVQRAEGCFSSFRVRVLKLACPTDTFLVYFTNGCPWLPKGWPLCASQHF